MFSKDSTLGNLCLGSTYNNNNNSGENNVEAQQEEQNRTSTKPIQQVTEQHIAQNEEDAGRSKENSEL